MCSSDGWSPMIKERPMPMIKEATDAQGKGAKRSASAMDMAQGKGAKQPRLSSHGGDFTSKGWSNEKPWFNEKGGKKGTLGKHGYQKADKGQKGFGKKGRWSGKWDNAAPAEAPAQTPVENGTPNEKWNDASPVEVETAAPPSPPEKIPIPKDLGWLEFVIDESAHYPLRKLPASMQKWWSPALARSKQLIKDIKKLCDPDFVENEEGVEADLVEDDLPSRQIRGFSNPWLNGIYTPKITERVNGWETYWAHDDFIFMYWNKESSNWTINLRWDEESVPGQRLDNLSDARAGKWEGLAFFSGHEGMECIQGQWSPVQLDFREVRPGEENTPWDVPIQEAVNDEMYAPPDVWDADDGFAAPAKEAKAALVRKLQDLRIKDEDIDAQWAGYCMDLGLGEDPAVYNEEALKGFFKLLGELDPLDDEADLVRKVNELRRKDSEIDAQWSGYCFGLGRGEDPAVYSEEDLKGFFEMIEEESAEAAPPPENDAGARQGQTASGTKAAAAAADDGFDRLFADSVEAKAQVQTQQMESSAAADLAQHLNHLRENDSEIDAQWSGYCIGLGRGEDPAVYSEEDLNGFFELIEETSGEASSSAPTKEKPALAQQMAADMTKEHAEVLESKDGQGGQEGIDQIEVAPYSTEGIEARLPPKGKPPPFDAKANGTPVDWNRRVTSYAWSKKTKKYFEPTDGASVDIGKVYSFLSLRPGPDGLPISNLLAEPEPKEDGWFRCPWKAFDESELPTDSPGQWGEEADWQRAWHGCKMEGLYSIMYHGKLFASCDESRGHRLLGNLHGVYAHKDLTEAKAGNYTRFVPLCRDGVFWAAKWELRVDRSDRVPASKKGTDQWVQEERSVRLVALWLCGRRVEDFVEGEELVEYWDPELEANPEMISRLVSDPTSQSDQAPEPASEAAPEMSQVEEPPQASADGMGADATATEPVAEAKDDTTEAMVDASRGDIDDLCADSGVDFDKLCEEMATEEPDLVSQMMVSGDVDFDELCAQVAQNGPEASEEDEFAKLIAEAEQGSG
mmetsp:Transcript_52875/g.97547  ORF Transcript_52875/g.97547 Transcript_52875/m.97547 type:complete len:1023 (-) Transcript_52875:89-3157(-)